MCQCGVHVVPCVSREIHFAPQDLNPEVSPTLSATAAPRVEQIAQVKDFYLHTLKCALGGSLLPCVVDLGRAVMWLRSMKDNFLRRLGNEQVEFTHEVTGSVNASCPFCVIVGVPVWTGTRLTDQATITMTNLSSHADSRRMNCYAIDRRTTSPIELCYFAGVV